MVKLKKAIFFDRDGILIYAPVVKGKPKSINSIKQLKFCSGINKICKYYRKNYYLIMVTNQPDFSRKINTKKNINEINNYIKKKLGLHSIYVCYSDNDKDPNRKPNPGMLLKAKKKYQINLKKSFMIGDRWRDIGAGKNANCSTIFMDRKYDERLLYKPNYKIDKLSSIYLIIKLYEKK